MNENQYKSLCEVCKQVLLLPDTTIERVAIPWLHVIREHPIVLEKYKDLFFPRKGVKEIYTHLKNTFYSKAIWFRQILMAIRWNGQPWFTADELPGKVDFLFISHLLNPNQFSQKDDFYFGSMPNDLINRKRSVVVASISHISGHFAFFKDKFVESNVPRLYFSASLNLADETAIRKRAKKEAHKLKNLAKNENRVLFRRVLFKTSREVMSGGTQRTLRLANQIHTLVTKLRPEAIIVPYEGHAFERIVFATARQVSPNIKCVSYQHTGVFRLSNAIRQTLSPQYNPDLILTSGSDGKSELENVPALKGIPVSVLGSGRGLVEYTGTPEIRFKPSGYGCLVIPEGFDSECMFLFRFSLLCAQQRSDITFIWRLHPSITFEKLSAGNPEFRNLPNNIILSSDTIEKDIARCNWSLYRGTTAIFKAISEGLRPLYLRLSGEMTIDPLYKMSDWRIIIDTPADFIACVNNDIDNDLKYHKANLDMARAICEKQFAKIDIDVLNKIISH